MEWVPAVVVAGFAIAAVFVIITIVRRIAEEISNNFKPVLTESARVTGKRTHVSGGGQHGYTRTRYYVTFELTQDGSRSEFNVSGKTYGELSEGDEGELTYQGRNEVPQVLPKMNPGRW